MKLPKVAALLFIISILTTGCTTSNESPENLLNDNIVYDKSKNELYTFINKSLDGTTLILPENSSEVGQINELDSNIIAFQKKEDVNSSMNKVGFVLISKENNNYSVKDSFLEEGEEIKYANFYDLNNDGIDEVILLINNNSVTTMDVYTIKNNKIKKISEVRPTWLDNYESLTSMKIEVGYLNNDGLSDKFKLDILMLNSDNSSGNIYATILNYDNDNNLQVSNSVKMTNVKSLDDLYTTVGKVYHNKKGVILSMPTLKESGYATQILYMKDNKLKKAFNEDDVIFNSYYVPVKDANSDGIIDIPVLNNKMIENYNASSKASSLVSWRKWNNKSGNGADTIFISQVYYNYKNNFKLLVPDKLANKLYIQKNLSGDTPYYIFYYYDKDDEEPIELFQIAVTPNSLVEDTKANPKMDSILAESENNSYQLLVKDKEAFEKYDLTIDNMKEYFSILYE